MSKDLVNPNEFWGNLEPAKDFAIPRVDIGQPTSKGEAGHFNFNNGRSDKVLKACKLLAPTKTRVLYSGDNASRCSSDDYYSPSQRVKDPISSNCMSCYASDWGEDHEKVMLAKEIGKQGSINPPLCKETYNILMLDEENAPFFIKFQGTQLKVVSQKLFSMLQFNFGNVLPYLVEFDMRLDLIQGSGKKYFSTVFENFKQVGETDVDEVTKKWENFKSVAMSILAKQHEDMDAEARDAEPTTPF
jgi:hypothetical protein